MSEILVGKSDRLLYLQARYANRHGMIAGATGTGKIGLADAAGRRLLQARRAGVSRRFGTTRRQGLLEAMAKSVVRNAGGQLGRSILRGVLGSMSR